MKPYEPLRWNLGSRALWRISLVSAEGARPVWAESLRQKDRADRVSGPPRGAGDVPVSCPDRGASPRAGFFRAFSGRSGASLQSALLEVVSSINNYLSSYILVILLIAVGLWYTIRTRFVQVRCFGEGMRRVFGSLTLRGKRHKSGMSSFQALATAIAAQVGTGNIVGASGAILIGGPGAIFWMWVIAFFGMATIYAEATLAVKTRRRDADGTIHGGPVY